MKLVEKKKTNKDEKKEDSIRRLELRYRGIKVDLLDAPRECAMRTCLVHCGAREAKLEGVDGREEEEMRTRGGRERRMEQGGAWRSVDVCVHGTRSPRRRTHVTSNCQ